MTVCTNTAENSLRDKREVYQRWRMSCLYMKNKAAILFILSKIHTYIVSSNVCNLKVTIWQYKRSLRSSGQKHLSLQTLRIWASALGWIFWMRFLHNKLSITIIHELPWFGAYWIPFYLTSKPWFISFASNVASKILCMYFSWWL